MYLSLSGAGFLAGWKCPSIWAVVHSASLLSDGKGVSLVATSTWSSAGSPSWHCPFLNAAVNVSAFLVLQRLPHMRVPRTCLCPVPAAASGEKVTGGVTHNAGRCLSKGSGKPLHPAVPWDPSQCPAEWLSSLSSPKNAVSPLC